MYIDSQTLGSYISHSSGALVATAPRGGYGGRNYGGRGREGRGGGRGYGGRGFEGRGLESRGFGFGRDGFRPVGGSPLRRILEQEHLAREAQQMLQTEGSQVGMSDAAFRRDDFRRAEPRADNRRRYYNAGLRRWSYDPVPVDSYVPEGWYRWWNPAHRRYELRRR